MTSSSVVWSLSVRMSVFDPSYVKLSDLYNEAYGTRRSTRVYANGVMQVVVFLSVNYNGNTTGIEGEIKKYVQENGVIYSLDTVNGGQYEVTWTKSFTSNDFHHDIDHAGKTRNISRIASDIRAPLYFTVPKSAPGMQKWIAKLGDIQTSTKLPVVVNVESYVVSSSNFEIVSKGSFGYSELRVLKYKEGVFKDTQVLNDIKDMKGILFLAAWISMLHRKCHKAGAFYKVPKQKPFAPFSVAKNGHLYHYYDMEVRGDAAPWAYRRYTSLLGWEDSLQMPLDLLQAAWFEGIIMIQIDERKHLGIMGYTGPAGYFQDSFAEDYFETEDTFGCRASIAIDWSGDCFGTWKVNEAYAV